MPYNDLETNLRDAVWSELSNFDVNNISGDVAITAEVRIPLELPSDWEVDGGDDYADVTIRKEFSL